MYENVFRRVEKKFIINKKDKDKFLKDIDKYITKDEFFISKINNIYFDNDNREFITNSMEKPIYKAKLRLRSYDVPTLNDSVFLEIKMKYDGVVGKRRIKIKLKDFYNYYEKGIMEDTQIMREIDHYFKNYDLKPFMFVAYDRESYKAINDKGLRITFDTNLRSRVDDLRLEKGGHGDAFLGPDEYIMEIKILDAMPLWLAHELSELKIYPTSYSKIGRIYTKRKKENLC